MQYAIIGVLTENRLDFISIQHNIDPQVAYPLLKTHYNSPRNIKQLFKQYRPTWTSLSIDNTVKVKDMRYGIKNLFSTNSHKPDYVYIYNTRRCDWYCLDLTKGGWVSQCTLYNYVA